MKKISWAGLNQQVYDIVNKIGEEYLEVMKDNLVNGRRSVQLSRQIFREAGLDHREYTPHYRTILEHTVMNVFYKKLGERQIPLSKMHKDMISTNNPLPKHDETELDALFDVPNVKHNYGVDDMRGFPTFKVSPDSPTGRNIDKQRRFAEMYGMSSTRIAAHMPVDATKANKFMEDFRKHSFDSQYRTNPCIINTDMTELENRVMAHTNLSVGYESTTNSCGEIFLGKPKTCSLVGLKADLLIIDDLEKPMSLSITRPLLVGNINILTASKEQLALIIREVQSQIEANADLAKVSVSYQQKQVELEEIITLCVEQLDKNIKAKLVEKKAFK